MADVADVDLEGPEPEPEPEDPSVREEEICCFGMIIDRSRIISPEFSCSTFPINLRHEFKSLTLLHSMSEVVGQLQSRTLEVIATLEKDLEIQLFLDSIPSPSEEPIKGRANGRSKREFNPLSDSVLCAVLYGPTKLFEKVGTFMSRCNLYLQHPKYCDKKVPYRNPHCLSRESKQILYTDNLYDVLKIDLPEPQAFANPIDLFADSVDQDVLPETDSPQTLKTKLYKHQKQALTFMLNREQGWALTGHHKDLWREETDTFGKIVYTNAITGQKQVKKPREFRGGLLADNPGLGKSLCMIALVANSRESGQPTPTPDGFCGATLLVVPKTLIDTWKEELRKHLRDPDTIKFCVYYGKDRDKYLTSLDDYALVITTYSVVRIDWKASVAQPESNTLHRQKWRRIVLDEAHIIREPSKSFAKSVCALEAERRWVVTGTPIQNRLKDLFSLFKFLQCAPFDDIKTFNTHVTQNWKARSDQVSVAKLKTLVNYLSLRRPKTTIKLPRRTDETTIIDFSPKEWQYYDWVRSSTRRALESNSQGYDFGSALAWVTELRLICNHGLESKHATEAMRAQPLSRPTAWTPKEAQLHFDRLDNSGLAVCSNPECGEDQSSTLSTEDNMKNVDEPWLSDAFELLCSVCYDSGTRGHGQFYKVCNHLPRCTVTPGCLTPSKRPLDTGSTAILYGVEVPSQEVPSKIQRLLQDLAQTPGIKRCHNFLILNVWSLTLSGYSVVFSSWTRTFDIIQPRLMSNSIRCIRLDGKMTASQRAKTLSTFRENPDIRVLLATITCGGVGLDLTAASRAYIMEPQWNPMSESQALDRIHRLGQEKEVTTIRYIVKGTWEEQVLKLQQRKQELADLTLSGGAISKEELTYQRLRHLKELVG
ncbi:MAG: hypothetical protein MMC33_008757 [Icmadophila ericetorum]|nr:hypothetical protein [Icmadophila ericetorum]